MPTGQAIELDRNVRRDRSVRAQRRIGKNGRIMVGNQRMYIARSMAGMIVTVVIEDIHFRILHDSEELAPSPAPPPSRSPRPKVKVYARHTGPTQALS